MASELNVADGPSRGQIRPGSYQGIPNSSEEPTQEQEGFGQQLEESYGGKVAHPSAHISFSERDTQGHSEQEEEVFPPLGEGAEVCAEDAGESIRNRSRPRQEEQIHQLGETIYLAGSGIPVCDALPGLLEFLPGARIRAAISFKHGCKPCRLYGRPLPGRPTHESRREDPGKHQVLQWGTQRKQRTLRGWRKEQPPQSRVPLPKLVVYGLCLKMIAQGKRAHALKTILDFDTCMRPGGSQDLMKKHLVITAPGAGSQFRWYGVIVRDYDELRPDKVGIFDSTLLLNSVERGWLGDMLHKHVKTLSRPNSKIFSFSSGDFRKTVSEVGEELGVDSIHPYQLRHGGASDNLNAKSRDYLAVKARGRWSTDQRVRRYGKV